MAAPSPKYRYQLDASDRIVWVDPLWLAFAQENGASSLVEGAVLGRTLWEFIAGEPTVRFYQELHQRIRETGKPLSVPFRCDSPTLKRYMQLRISPNDNGLLDCVSLLLRVESVDRVRLLDAATPRSGATLTMCSCCKRGLLESAGWLEAQALEDRLGLTKSRFAPRLRHTLCPDCAKLSWN